MSQAAASADQKDWLQCDNEVDIQAGDELIIHRGAVLGKSIPDIRAFASGPNHFFEPFGAIMPGLAHQESQLAGYSLSNGEGGHHAGHRGRCGGHATQGERFEGS